MMFNSFFGVRFVNHLSNMEEPHEVYRDIDLELYVKTDKFFVVIHDEKLYVTSNGLSFVDIIYAGDFNAAHDQDFYLEFDSDYIFPNMAPAMYRYEVLDLDLIPEALQEQLSVIRDSMSVEADEIDEEIRQTGTSSKIDINKRLFYEAVYEHGTVCKVTNKPRKTRIHFYCDQYRIDQDQALAVIDISEPDYCEYLIKVATKFMCAAGTQFKKASRNLHPDERTNLDARPAVDLDSGMKTVKKRLTCNIKSDF